MRRAVPLVGSIRRPRFRPGQYGHADDGGQTLRRSPPPGRWPRTSSCIDLDAQPGQHGQGGRPESAPRGDAPPDDLLGSTNTGQALTVDDFQGATVCFSTLTAGWDNPFVLHVCFDADCAKAVAGIFGSLGLPVLIKAVVRRHHLRDHRSSGRGIRMGRVGNPRLRCVLGTLDLWGLQRLQERCLHAHPDALDIRSHRSWMVHNHHLTRQPPHPGRRHGPAVVRRVTAETPLTGIYVKLRNAAACGDLSRSLVPSTAAPSPSITLIPRAASCSRCSRSGRGAVQEQGHIGPPLTPHQCLRGGFEELPASLTDSYYPAEVGCGHCHRTESARIRGGAHAVIEDPAGPIRRTDRAVSR